MHHLMLQPYEPGSSTKEKRNLVNITVSGLVRSHLKAKKEKQIVGKKGDTAETNL